MQNVLRIILNRIGGENMPTKSELLEQAENLGVEVDESMTKAEIELAMEGRSEVAEEAAEGETDPSTHTVDRANAVDPNSPQYVR